MDPALIPDYAILPALAAGALWGTISTFVLRMLFYIVPWLLHYGLVALGFAAVTYVGLDFAMQEAIDRLLDRYDAIPVEIVGMVQTMGVLDAILIVTSTASSCIALKITAGVTRWVANRPATLKA